MVHEAETFRAAGPNKVRLSALWANILEYSIRAETVREVQIAVLESAKDEVIKRIELAQWNWPWPPCICHVADDYADKSVHAWYCNLAERRQKLTDEQVREMMA